MPIPETFDPSQPLPDKETEQEVSEEAARELRKRFIVSDYEANHAPTPQPGPEKCGYVSRLTGKVCVASRGHRGAHDLQRPEQEQE